mgnify:CR=1 FL=1
MLKKTFLVSTLSVVVFGLSGCSTIEEQWNAFDQWWQPGKTITSPWHDKVASSILAWCAFAS